MRSIQRTAVAALLLLAAGSAARGAGLEEQLNARWQGGYAVVRLPIASSCDGFYNDNDVVGSRVDSKARRRFEAGELVRVERIGTRRGRVDVFLDLAEDVLEEIHDGPFTLYEPKSCKVQLKVPVPERWEAAQVEVRLAELLERHESAREAEDSSAWNGRRREPFPAGYEKTLAAYETFRANRINATVQARMETAIEEASRITDRVRSDPEYLEGFAAGIDRVRNQSFGDCGSRIGSGYFSPSSGGGGKGSDWKRGYEDGQRLGWNLELLRRLKECFVPVPTPAPAG